MKKTFLIAITFLIVCIAQRVAAQTIEEANKLYKEFVQLINSSSNKAEIYDALYRCYTSTATVLETSKSTSVAHSQALNNMKDIARYLPNGAAYSSSAGQQANAVLFARAYVDVAVMDEFEGEGLTSSASFAQLSYFAAANLVNNHNYKAAIPYLKAYIRSGEEKYRKSVFINLSKACAQVKDYSGGVAALDEALSNYPNDYDIASTAVNFCIDSGDNDNLQRFVKKALAIRPNDKTLLNIQGKLYEETRDFGAALAVYTNLQKTNPRALDVIKHLAINNYNLGVLNYNNSLSQSDKGELKKLKGVYTSYFNAAIEHLRSVVQSDPSSIKYTQALAVAYNCVGNKSQLEAVNNKLASMGAGRVGDDYIPSLISFSHEGAVDIAATGGSSHKSASPVGNISSTTTASYALSDASDGSGVPSYSTFAKEYIERVVNDWQQKDDYETLAEYRERVNESTRSDKIRETQLLAEEEYIKRYSPMVDFATFELHPYDAENGVFLITSEMVGQMIVPVPRSNNEARLFESNWNGMQFKAPKYFIEDDRLAIANLTFVTPTGKQYQYDNEAALNYTVTTVDVNFKPIDDAFVASTTTSGKKSGGKVSEVNVSVGNSDVDMNIPETKSSNDRSFAVIIANENYINVAGVPMALNDGATFAKYCEKTLGMPHSNVRTYSDASYGTMLRAMRDIRDIATAYNGDINIVFYYAGHGIPNEATKDAFLLPVDADGQQTEGCYSLNRLYTELGATGARSIVVFLDACFSGSKREDGMLASARGVALKAKKEDPRGNMVVFSAATDDETAFPYKEKGHGLFTYYLLKALQESKGSASLGELSDYITSNVRQQSVVINHKTQTPTATPSSTLTANWRSMTLK